MTHVGRDGRRHELHDAWSHDGARLRLRTLSDTIRLLRLARLRTFPDLFLFFVLPVIIAVYVYAGYLVILAPGSLYQSIVAGDVDAFRAAMVSYAALASALLFVKVLRGALRESCALVLRNRIAHALHKFYVTEHPSHTAGERSEQSNRSAPPYYTLADGSIIDNPDQRVVSDAREFASSLFEIIAGGSAMGGDSGGIVEAGGSVVWYTIATARRTGWVGIVAAYGWSAAVAVVTVAIINIVSPWVYKQEELEAKLRYGHVALRRCAEQIAFLRGGHFERRKLNEQLDRCVSNAWVVIQRHAYLNLVQYGFAYYVSLVMYGAIGLAIFSNVMESSSSSFSSSMSPGEKAKWISQTGGVFIQLLFAFTSLVQLGTTVTGFVANASRLCQFVEFVQPKRDKLKPAGSVLPAAHEQNVSSTDSGYGRKYHEETCSLLRSHCPSDGESPSKSNWQKNDMLEVRGLTVKVGQERLIGPVTTGVRRGQMVLLDGPSGCGKSSVLRVLRGLWNAGEGAFAFSCDASDVAFLPQLPYIGENCSLRELITYPELPVCSPLETDRAVEVLSQCGWKLRVDGGLLDSKEMAWHERLSPGEAQKLAIARVLFHQPELTIMDEPTSSLDADSEELIFSSLRKANMSILTTGHNSNVHKFHDSVVSMTAKE